VQLSRILTAGTPIEGSNHVVCYTSLQATQKRQAVPYTPKAKAITIGGHPQQFEFDRENKPQLKTCYTRRYPSTLNSVHTRAACAVACAAQHTAQL
jgi:mitochondrial fission protein ELM1